MLDFKNEPNILFAFGHPKSGTTYLQMILNSHPEVSCPSEHQFDFFIKELPRLLDNYNKLLLLVDQKTANQGASLFTGEDLDRLFSFIVYLAALRGAQNKKDTDKIKCYGINDNAIINRLFMYIKLFPNAKFICIVRDPRSIVVSSWYNNLRVEPGFLQNRGKNKEYWAMQVANFWVRDMQNVLNFADNFPKKIFLIRYEDLRLDPFSNYKKIFSFLGVNTNDNIIENVIKKTSFNKFKNGKFFRKASIDDWKEELSREAIYNVESKALKIMKVFNYEPFIKPSVSG